MNDTCHLSEVELVMCASFLVILKFLFDDPLSNFFHIHTGNGLEEVLAMQETGEEKKQRKRHKKTETNPRAEEKEIFSLLFFLLFFLMEMMMMMISTMMMGMTLGMMTMMIQHC